MQALEKREEEQKQNVLVIFDEWDENQISQEIKGEIVEAYFYKYEQPKNSGNWITGISYTGVRFMANKMALEGMPITIDHSDVSEAEDSFRGKAVARNITTGVSYPGFSETKKEFSSGSENRFAYVIAASKAERNAIRKHLPETAIIAAYEEWKDKKNAVRNVTPVKDDPSKDSSKTNLEKNSEKGKVILGSSGFLDGGK